ncbi:glycine betaine/L-proline ABC transporter, ATPase subunit [Denitrovibrio acetiphilus DSM 12809]|uniref:Glycine betaine/L-proline ABC transporter, ATPase subunit n=1 Tax=Denitrovibrio acetiphilus (strain DSM 12809 / NBRC 114555 / N2460) TaxID=522772 RepID=D4H3U5_DENA2|nr:ABC transporter ATP-binding protein [Denitrovibrio acetiphilus]ADD69197.1 glycine betaine/L-proline ABC transporter, ATPase subunit [Denitrovibrio acetiphilus DSM 12809]
MIELRELSKKYGEATAVDGISLSINEGEMCVLIGPSGCGKSTTLKMINRMIDMSSGDVYVRGQNIKDQKAEILRRRIGYVIQSIGLFPHMTVGENIAVVPKLLKWKDEKIKAQVDSLLELVELGAEYADKYPSQLSGGEAQRVGVARALAAEPEILLMDEPFGALDPVTRESLQKGLLRIQKKLKKTVVFVTHDIDEAVRLATKIAIMKDGRIMQYDTPQNILSSPADKFTAKFVGKDRALKNLSRKYANEIMEKTAVVSLHAEMSEAETLFDGKVYLWVVNDEGELKGWLNKSDNSGGDCVEDNMSEVDTAEYSISEDSTLKDALSKLVMHGVVVLPVTKGDVVVGEVDIQKILEAGSE